MKKKYEESIQKYAIYLIDEKMREYDDTAIGIAIDAYKDGLNDAISLLWHDVKEPPAMEKDTPPDHATPFYWMDFGNAQFTGQVLIGTVRNRIAQPASKEFIAIPKMNVITEEVSYSMIRDTDSGPSCSLTEALHKQDLFINSMLAQAGCEILWKMIREGRTPYRGAYLNMETLRLVPIPV